MANSFYVPGSLSGSYVASKRTEEGSLAYPAAETEIGIQKQAALQNLGKQYETTIENAYASYLASQRNVMESAMGQGYKERYLEMQDQALAANLAEVGTNVASARAELEAQESEAKSIVQEQYKQEVTNLDRAAASFQHYLDYVKELSYTDPKTKETTYALDPEHANLGIDYLYEELYGLQPREANLEGMSYSEWLLASMGDTQEDAAWYEWAQSGGIQDFLSSVRARPDYQTAEQKITTDIAAKEQQEKTIKLADNISKGLIGTADPSTNIGTKADIAFGVKSTAKPGDEIIVTNNDNTTTKYVVSHGLVLNPTKLTIYHDLFNDKALNNYKNLDKNDIVMTKTGTPFLYLGLKNGQPYFVALEKAE